MTSTAPPAWRYRNLGEASVVLDNLRFPLSAAQRAIRNGPYPYCGANGVLDHIDDYMIDDDVILLAEDGGNFDQWRTRPIAYRMKGKIWVNNHAHVLKAANGGDTGFLFYALEHKDITSFISSGTRSKLTRGELVRINVLMPDSLDEQRLIAGALSDADALVASLQRLITKKEAIKQGLMQQLLTGQARLPGFTGAWHVVHLGKHVTYVKTVALSRAQLDQTSPLRYLHYGDIHACSAATLDASAEAMPRAELRLAGRAGRLSSGDLVFADASEDAAGVGKSVEITAVPPEGVVPGLHTIAARFDKSVLADGFKAYLQFIPTFRNTLLRLAAGTKVLATTRAYISSVELALPDVPEQQAIAAVLQACDAEIEALRSRLAKARALKTGLMQQLLTGRTRLTRGTPS